jgi:hypothetical protein
VGEDRKASYTDVLTRCFIAEGVCHKHSIFVADLSEDKEKLFQVSTLVCLFFRFSLSFIVIFPTITLENSIGEQNRRESLRCE